MEIGSRSFKAKRNWRKLRDWVKGTLPQRRGMSYRAYKAITPLHVNYNPRVIKNRQRAQYRRWFRNTRTNRRKSMIKRQYRGFY